MLNKVTDYKILEATDPATLMPQVKQALAEAWVPSGPLIYAQGYMQVMVKFEE